MPSSPLDKRASASARRLKSSSSTTKTDRSTGKHGRVASLDASRDAMSKSSVNSSSPTTTNFDSSSMAAGLQDSLSARAMAGAASPKEAWIGGEPTASQKQLNEYRERLARDIERRDLSARGLAVKPDIKSRVSPIQEENRPTPPQPLPSATTTTSTESGHTIRGSNTPVNIAGTPSYPFPRMAAAALGSSNLHRPFTTLSPTGPPRPYYANMTDNRRAHDKVLSGNSTPASAFTFNPAGMSPHAEPFDFPTPNLYELSLMLSSEPGLDAWWNTVVQIMKDVYKAERVTLAVPADTTDVENVPWGQKATYNEHEGDELSLGYLARTNSMMPSSNHDSTMGTPQPNTPLRPGIASRHSFTSYEENKQRALGAQSDQRPQFLTRSRSYFPQAPLDQTDETQLSSLALHEHDVQEQHDVPAWDAPFMTDKSEEGRVLPVLQALDYEADPLLDHTGVTRVLERGKTVALTRSYPYLENEVVPEPQSKPVNQTKKPTNKRPEFSSRLTSIFGNASSRSKTAGDRGKSIAARLEQDTPRPPTPKYEEYEQAPPSPWSQSPAPSPAVRADPKDNPFFSDAMVDEDSFNPGSAPADYTGIRPPEAIGVENSWTVLHIPLRHVLLTRSTPSFKLDQSTMDQKRGKEERERREPERQISDATMRSKNAPIAILSVLTPMIPYPLNLRHSLEHLAPHMATSFSLCQHYSNLETELVGLRRRPRNLAGMVGPDGRPLTSSTGLAAGEFSLPQSMPGSITSPSEYSAVSKSISGSPIGTPGWEHGSLTFIADKRPTPSPAATSTTGDSYFSSKQRSASVRHEVVSSSVQGSSKETSPPDKRHTKLSAAKSQQDVELREQGDRSKTKENQEFEPPPGMIPDEPTERARQKMLHTRGADFASTFGSLPQNASLPGRPAASRQASHISTAPTEMVSPTDKLTRLILDSLPVHVFVAAIPEEKSWDKNLSWVNSRFLSYRGLTAADLAADHWSSIHPGDRNDFLKAWKHSILTHEQFSRTVRIKRFDGAYRWFHARAVGSKDKGGRIRQWLGSYMDIHDQHIAELKAARQQEIEASEAKHRLLANLIPQIIFTATEEDGITFANEQWLSYTGQTFEDSLELGFMDFVHPDDLAKCRIPQARTALTAEATPSEAATIVAQETVKSLSRTSSSTNSLPELPSAHLAELARKGTIKVGTDSSGRLSYTTEVRLRSRSGEYRWHLIRCVEIDTIDFGSGASSYFGSATDINDHKLLETKLKEAMESKSRFLSNMSHEIRTPLIGISGMVTFLQDTILNEEQRDYTNTIQMSANNLIMIINDILDLSKVDAGMMKLKYDWFHTRSLIEDVNELLSTMAIAKGLELNYLVEVDVPTWVKGDKFRIRQVLLNVIGNAIKFTSEGEVFSRCKVVRDDTCEENEILLQYAITDTGKGFTEEEAELIFKPFSQIDGSSTRQHGGSGLGLVISKQLVELHGGQMGATAIAGSGSIFTFSARFTLPTDTEHPDIAGSPAMVGLPRPVKQLASPAITDLGLASPVVTSNGSSVLSVQSGRSHITDRSSVTSVNTGFARFSEAAKASGHDLSQMKLEMPSGRSSPGRTTSLGQVEDLRPPMYSILIICPQANSREATTQHIETTLPKNVPHQIMALATVDEAQQFIGGDDPVRFTHIVINLTSAQAVISLIDQITKTQTVGKTTILILSDSTQRQTVAKLAKGTPNEELLSQNLVTFIYKPVKPSRFAVIFDPDKVQDMSIDHNRSTAQQMVESQKASYQEIERRMGNKGYKVLLVEDNLVNQKVLTKYLKKIGVEVDVVDDGVECTETVLSRPHEYYSLILCDLHMPRKDGYQACREIRQWEKTANHRTMPIIALSANVMSDVQDKCVAAGFSDYVTKPVDFIDLSRAMAKFF